MYDVVALLDGVVLNCQVKGVNSGKVPKFTPLTSEFERFAGKGRGLAAPEPLLGWAILACALPLNGNRDEEELTTGVMELHFHVQKILSEKRLSHKEAA